jgi:pullulanase/glycogen debranching enzyme
MEIWPGNPYPLGATYDGTGVNFAIFSEVAEKIELCLIGERGKEIRIPLPEVDGFSGATRPSSFSTRTPRRSTARCAVTPRCSGTT